MLRIVGSGAAAQGRSEWLRVESNKKHVSVFSLDCGSSQAQRDVNQAAKLYAFDSVFTDDTSLVRVTFKLLSSVLCLTGKDGVHNIYFKFFCERNGNTYSKAQRILRFPKQSVIIADSTLS